MRATKGRIETRFQAPPASQTEDRRDLRYVEICGFAGAFPPDVSLRFARRGGWSANFCLLNTLQDVSALLETQSLDGAMALILKLVGNGATDYGQVWLDLHDRRWDPIDRRTTVIVLGDGRSNGANPRLDLFATLVGLLSGSCGCAPSLKAAGVAGTATCCATDRFAQA